MSNTTLDGFISKLMSDDSALKKFLVDPTNGGQEHGITKAERAVLRRVTAHLSNTSKNGFGIQRDLSSYRRSLRLLQNVLHKHSATHAAVLDAESGMQTFSFYVYITGTPSTLPITDPNKNPAGAPYYNPALAYTNFIHFTTSGTNIETISDAMHFPKNKQGTQGEITDSISLGSGYDKYNVQGTISYKAVFNEGEWYVLEFDLQGFSPGIAGTYQLPFEVPGTKVTGKDRFPFWFFSLDGKAIEPQGQGYGLTGNPTGADGGSFTKYQVADHTQIVWQPIAPHMDYGFGSCFPSTYAPVVLGIPVLQKPAKTKGELFYTKTTDVVIPADATKITLALNPDGTGDIRTDDVVKIIFANRTGSYEYNHDYSQNCIGYITPTAPVDLTSDLSKFKGQTVTVNLSCFDKCGGFVSTSGYFLVFE